MKRGDNAGGHEVFVTGVTGMIGGELLGVLLSQGWPVRAFVRAGDSAAAARRVRDRLAKSGREALADDTNLVVAPGDITVGGLGLAEEAKENISQIVHCAGHTSFKDEAQAWDVNVGGIKNLIALARSLPLRPRITFVSTAGVCTAPSHSVLFETFEYAGHENGYIRAKRKAERLLLESGLEVLIVRPSIVLSAGIKDRRMARSVLWCIPAMIELKEVPVDPESRLDIVPVGFVVRSIEKLLRKTALRWRLYHVSAGETKSSSCVELGAVLRSTGLKPISLLGCEAGHLHPEKNGLHRRLREALKFYLPFLNADAVYSRRRLDEELGTDLPDCPKATKLIGKLMEQVSEKEAFAASEDP
jgi:nucleoside-diphosphate-sugar epimerase